MAKIQERILVGKELRIAAKDGLEVRYQENYHDPAQEAVDEVCVMEPARYGYYIGPSDIEPDFFEDNEAVAGDFIEGDFKVLAVSGVDYS